LIPRHPEFQPSAPRQKEGRGQEIWH